MNWLKVIRSAAITTVFAFVISSVLMLFLNSRVNWMQQCTTALLFFIGSAIISFLRERKISKTSSGEPEL